MGSFWKALSVEVMETTPSLAVNEQKRFTVVQVTTHSMARDSLYGENGADVIRIGQPGLTTAQNRAYAHGGPEDDRIFGLNGSDTLWGGSGNDIIRARPGKDLVYGGSGNDVLDGGNHDDTLEGGTGNDTLQGKKGNDLARGQEDDDVLVNTVVDKGNDTLQGGDGIDLVRMKGLSTSEIFELNWTPLEEALLEISSDEPIAHLNIIHKNAEGTMIEQEMAYEIERTHIAGFGGSDVLDFSDLSAADLIDASIQELHGYGGSGNDILAGSDGPESLYGGSGWDELWGNEGNDHIDGGTGNDILEGDEGNDTIVGGTGNDQLDGKMGNDKLDGQAGNDSLYGD